MNLQTAKRWFLRFALLGVFGGLLLFVRALDNHEGQASRSAHTDRDRQVGQVDGASAGAEQSGTSSLVREASEAAQSDRVTTSEKQRPSGPVAMRYVHCRVYGLIHSGPEIALPGRGHVRVSALLAEDDESAEPREISAEGYSDADGRYSLDLDLPIARSTWKYRRTLTLTATVPGCAPYMCDLSVDIVGDVREIKRDVVVVPGGGYVGRVVDDSGQPVGRALVSLYADSGLALSQAASSPDPSQLAGAADITGESGVSEATARRSEAASLRGAEAAADRTWVEVISTLSVADGSFSLPTRGAGVYSLRAKADSTGASFQFLGGTDGSALIELGELPLAGLGELSGRVMDPSGVGLEGVTVRALHESLVDDELNIAAMTALRVGDLPGLRSASVESRSEGRFRLAGLSPGRYWLWVEGEGLSPGVANSLGNAGSVSSADSADGIGGEAWRNRAHGPITVGQEGSDKIELTVNSYRVDLVILPDTSGASLRGQAFCDALRMGPGGYVPIETRPRVSALGRESLSFPVIPGRTYAVGVSSSSKGITERIVTIEPGEFRKTVELQSERKGGFGSVRVRVRGDGDSLDVAKVEISSADSGIPFQAHIVPLSSDRRLIDLPPGRYRITANPRAWTRTGVMLLAGHGEVEVRSGEVSNVSVRCELGGGLRVELELPEPLQDPELLSAFELIRDFGQMPSRELRTRRGARLRLSPMNDEGGIDLTFQTAPGVRPEPPDRLLPGESGLVQEVIEPGTYVLEMEIAGCQPVRRILEIEQEETLEVALSVIELK